MWNSTNGLVADSLRDNDAIFDARRVRHPPMSGGQSSSHTAALIIKRLVAHGPRDSSRRPACTPTDK